MQKLYFSSAPIKFAEIPRLTRTIPKKLKGELQKKTAEFTQINGKEFLFPRREWLVGQMFERYWKN